MSKRRIKFYSVHDLLRFENIENVVKIISEFDEQNIYTINDIIELYEIKLHFDHDLSLASWTADDITSYKAVVKRMWTVIVRYFQTINDDNFIKIFKELESWKIEDTFWKLISILKTYKQISHETIKALRTTTKVHVHLILHFENLVNYYQDEIRKLLLDDSKSAELILSEYIQEQKFDSRKLYFPKCLTLKDREDILLKYLDSPTPNLNYVTLILNTKKQDHLYVSAQTKRKAKKVEKRLKEEMINDAYLIVAGVNVFFCDFQDNPVIYKSENNIDSYSYSKDYIFRYDNPCYYLNIIANLFEYLDEQCCISLVSKPSDLNFLESSSISSKYEYKTGIVFFRKDQLSLRQIASFEYEIQQDRKTSLENIIHYYITEYIQSKYNIKGFRFKTPSKESSYLEKIRMLLPELDSFLRQFMILCEESVIDHELLEMNSEQFGLSQIPSLIQNKYVYKNQYILTPQINLFFSNQSVLCHFDSLANKEYNCFYDIIVNETINYNELYNFQKEQIDLLIESNLVTKHQNGNIEIINENNIFILEQLYNHGVLNYWHYDENCREIIDQYIKEDVLYVESTLFNKFECDYFNYFMNMKDFTNGMDLRNRFLHGTNPVSESEIHYSYFVLLRIIILTILKVDNDLLLNSKINK